MRIKNLAKAEESVRITISLPVSALETLDILVAENHSRRSSIIKALLQDVVKNRLETQMAEGYQVMANLAAEIAEYDLEAVNESWPEY